MQPSRPLQNREEAGFQGATSVRIAMARISQIAKSGRSSVPRGHICANSDSTDISGCKIGKKQGSKPRQPFGGARGVLAPSPLPAAAGGIIDFATALMQPCSAIDF